MDVCYNDTGDNMKQKGFTLVELLAVIVILAIIALITIPIVLKTINNSQKESEKQSIAGYARAIEDDIANYMMINPGNKYEDYTPTKDFDYKGNKVFCDSRIVSSIGKLTLNNCYVSDKELTSEEIKKKNIRFYKYENGKVELINLSQNNNSTNTNETNTTSPTYTEYKIGDEITIAGEQYYVISDSGIEQDYVTALKAKALLYSEVSPYLDSTEVFKEVSRQNENNQSWNGIFFDFCRITSEKEEMIINSED